MKTKTFDCVEMMHAAALRIHEETKDMTIAEQAAWWRKVEERQRSREKKAPRKTTRKLRQATPSIA